MPSPTDLDLQLERIPPGRVPGALWRRITTTDRLLRDGPLTDVSWVAAEGDRLLTEAWAAEHEETVWIHIYDGDTGECTLTITCERPPGECTAVTIISERQPRGSRP